MNRNRNRNRNGQSDMPMVLVLLAFILMVAQDSNASILSQFRKLINDNNNPSHKVSPDSAPAQAPAPGPGPPSDGLSIRNCTSSLKTCNNKYHINITACLISSSNAKTELFLLKTELFLLVENHGESSVEVTVKTNASSQIITIPKHNKIKVNVTDGRSSSPITLNAGNNNNACVIRFESPSPYNNSFFSFRDLHYYATPLTGVYLLVLSGLVFGGMWACCVLGKKGQKHADGVPYQELEMARPNGEGDWDQGWADDDWSSPTTPRQNDNTSDRDGWENTWDD